MTLVWLTRLGVAITSYVQLKIKNLDDVHNCISTGALVLEARWLNSLILMQLIKIIIFSAWDAILMALEHSSKKTPATPIAN